MICIAFVCLQVVTPISEYIQYHEKYENGTLPNDLPVTKRALHPPNRYE